MKYDVIVVGGGIGGLGCAALLAKGGMKVLVLERSSFLGGRATSFKYKDYLLDVGMHVMSLGDVSPTEELLRRVGVKAHYVWTEGLDFYTPEAWEDITQYRRKSKGDDSDLKAIVQEILSMPKEALDALDDISMKSWLNQRTDRKVVQDLFRMIGWWYGISDTKDLAASEILYEIKRSLEKRHTLATGNQVVGGFKALIQPLKRAILKRGGEVRTESEVNEVVIDKGEVKGVLVNQKAKIPEEIKGKVIPEVEFISCPIVICALPMNQLFDIVPQEKLPREFVEKVNRILNSQLGIYYGFAVGLKKEVSSSKRYYGTDRFLYDRIPEDMCLHAEYLSNFDSTYVPKG
jgi:phytoene dehydrogenase-like protein